MKRLVSILMSMVMAVMTLPMMSFAEEQSAQQNEKCPVGGVQDAFFQVVSVAKEKAPQVWGKIKPYVDKGKIWCKDYCKSALEFAGKVGKLGVAVTVVLSALVGKVVYKAGGFVTRFIWPMPKTAPAAQ